MEQNGSDHIQSYRELALVLTALLVLTAVTITASRLNLGAFKIVTALAIACTKCSLVLYFFMHMRKGGKVVAITFTVTIIILAIFIGFIFFDIAYR